MKNFLFFLVLLIIPLILSGCIIKLNNGASGTDGGVFRSMDKIESWEQKVLISTVAAEKETIAGVNVREMIFDPQDYQAIYLATNENGLFYTYDGGDSWRRVAQFNAGKINSLAIDYYSKCIIYVAQDRRIYKSTDCARSWLIIYLDDRVGESINYLAVDPVDSDIILAGLATGEIIRSTDGGYSWATLHKFNNPVRKILYNLHNPNIIYVATATAGIFKSTDNGLIWQDINQGLAEYSGSKNYYNLILDHTQTDALVLVSNYGIITSNDGGETWLPLTLLTPPGQATIRSIALNPQNNQEIYYGTASTLYKSEDGGVSWVTKRLPTSRAATALLVNPLTPNVVYLAVTRIEQ